MRALADKKATNLTAIKIIAIAIGSNQIPQDGYELH